MAQTAINGRRWDRGAWLTVALVGGFIVLCAAIGGLALSQPGDGCQFVGGDLSAPRPLQACLGDWPTPLRAGDRIVAVDGAPLAGTQTDSTLIARPAPPGWVAGGQIRYQVQRDGALLDLVVPLGRLGPGAIARAFGLSLVGQLDGFMLPIILGSIVLMLLAPGSGAARLLLIAAAPLLAVLVFIWGADTVARQYLTGPIWVLYNSALFAWGWQFTPTLLLLVLSFPRRVGPIHRWPARSAVLIYALPLATLALSFQIGNITASFALFGLYALLVVVSAASITLHTFLRGRDPVLRAQTAWLAFGVAVGFALVPLVWALSGAVPGLIEGFQRLPAWLTGLLILPIGLTFPLSMGIAITRYRLFDIELVIRRTLIYSILTVMLALTYFGSVIVLQGAVGALGGARSEWIMVVSTLMVAALVLPLRRRIQAFIDRRFYRRKYDAVKAVAEFAAVARDETDLDALTARLTSVVQEAMEPEQVTIWLRPPPRS
jgi:hypothetical protein